MTWKGVGIVVLHRLMRVLVCVVRMRLGPNMTLVLVGLVLIQRLVILVVLAVVMLMILSSVLGFRVSSRILLIGVLLLLMVVLVVVLFILLVLSIGMMRLLVMLRCISRLNFVSSHFFESYEENSRLF